MRPMTHHLPLTHVLTTFTMSRYWYALVLGLGLSLLATLPSVAQNEVLLPFLEQLPQATYRNPTARPQGKFSIGLPLISSFGVGYRNSAFSYADITYAKKDSTIIDPNKMIEKMDRGSNYIYFGNTYDLVHVGWRMGKTWWMVNLSDHIETHISLPGDMAKLAWQGNVGFARTGTTADFSSLNIKATHYRELGLLMQWELTDQWLLGVKPKVLFGLSNAEITRSDLSLNTDTTNPFILNARTDFELRTSTGPFDTKNGNSAASGLFAQYYLNFSNPGFGGDLGLRYTPKDTKWDLSAALTNVGFIYWTKNTRTYTGSSNPVSYRGLTYSGLVQNDQFVGINAIGDSIKNTLGYTETSSSYVSSLTAQATLQGQYHATDWLSLGASVNAWAFEGIRSAAQLNALIKYNRLVGFGTSYTIQNGRFDNVGLGIYFKPGPIQLYLVSDNILGFIRPTNTYNTNIRTGMNLVFGRKPDRDKDGIEDTKDKCPDQPGTKALDGCPDRDNDGITDKDDQCPTEVGTAENKGCPDRDKDGILDKEDKCPDAPGLKALAGCPDRDGDGLTDAADTCPDSAGLAYLNGCPDLDGDSIPNYQDKCPTVKGPKSNNGCPVIVKEEPKPEPVPEPVQPVIVLDTDNDGLLDPNDACPTEAGPASNKGCPIPDSDGDGVLDPQDECPKTPGPASNKGCPVLEARQAAIVKRAFANLEFDFNKASIRATSLPALTELAKVLKETPTLRLTLSGHTDNAGNAKANLELSKRRTLAVQTYLLKAGAAKTQITSLWYGDKKPIASNKTPAGRTKNRRVEMKLQYE